MTPWAVVSGKVKFDDAEPAVNVAIQLYREYFSRGRHGYALAASTRTDDRGDYRMHGLEPGSYYVAALYQAPALPPDAKEQRDERQRLDILEQGDEHEARGGRRERIAEQRFLSPAHRRARQHDANGKGGG